MSWVVSESMQGVLAFLGAAGWIALDAAAVVAAGVLAYWLLKKLLNKFFRAKGADNRRLLTLGTLAVSLLKYVIIVACGVGLLGVFGLKSAAQTLLAGAGIAALVLGLAAQDLIRDIISGCSLMLENTYQVGDLITVGGLTGTVVSVSLRLTVIESFDGKVHSLPNRTIDQVSNLSRADSLAIADIKLDPAQNIAAASAAIASAMPLVAEEFAGDITQAPSVLGVIGQDALGVTVRIIAKTIPLKHFALERAMRGAAIDALHANGFKLCALGSVPQNE